MRPVPPQTVARAVNRVFQEPAYDRSVERSLLLDVWHWIQERINQFLHALERAPAAAAIVKYSALTLALLIVGAVAYRLFRHYRDTRGDAQVRFGTDNVADLWKESERAAAHGDHTTAAHLLYAALLRTLVLRNAVRFHNSKTTGDYARELRRRGGVFVAPFTAFVRAYEVVIYRDGTCDADRYAMLRRLADPVVRPQQAAA